MPRLAVIGTGVIGSGWAARALARGLEVRAWDPAPGYAVQLRAAVANAWPALRRVGLARGATRRRLRIAATLAEAVEGADFIQENAPEDESLKRDLIAQIDAVASSRVVIASSSSGFLPSRLQDRCRHPERVLVGHPFNPVYLLPLVEVVGGKQTAPVRIEAAIRFYRSLGMRPLHVRSEVEGYLSDRLQEALWREALHLVAAGVATTQELDDAVIYGPGLRWAFMGTCLAFHMAGGEAGMRHMLEQFAIGQNSWTRLPAPKVTSTLARRMISGTAAQAKRRSMKQLERWRDDRLIRVLEAVAK
ncbi:MAG TPA: L-carnitine dehydrogenase [Candidatus Limnocylindrales bacterium]|nr:L-carnitine dehydrogenase [Candidatus Limnocylindrales bacterium]